MNIVVVVAAILVAGESGSACRFDWLPTGMGMPGLDGEVYCSTAWDPDGPGPQEELLVVGGSFRIAGNVLAPGIAAWDGERWHALGDGVDGDVTAMTVYDGDLVVSGSRWSPVDVWHGTIRRWDGVAWHAMDTGLVASRVNAFATYHGDLIAAGQLTVEGVEATTNIARWKDARWRTLGTAPASESQIESVYSLAVLGGDLIAGGWFNEAGGRPANRIARWDGSRWYDMAGGVEGPLTSSFAWVTALLVAEDQLIVGGAFERAGGMPARNIARWDGTAWLPFGSLEDGVAALTALRGEVVAAAYEVHRWDGHNWVPFAQGMGDAWDPLVPTCEFIVYDTSILTLAVYKDRLIAGGRFKFAGGKAARHAAQWNGDSWQAFGDGMSIAPSAMISHEGNLITAGGFRTLTDQGMARGQIAEWNGRDWEFLGDGVDGTVLSLTTFGGDIIIGGHFTIPSDDTLIRHLAWWDGAEWRSFGLGIRRSDACDATVYALAEFGEELIAGGSFSGAGESMNYGLARWNRSIWQPLWSDVSGGVIDIAKQSQNLVVGGGLRFGDTAPVFHVLAWDGMTWKVINHGQIGYFVGLVKSGTNIVVFVSPYDEYPATHVLGCDGSICSIKTPNLDDFVTDGTDYMGDFFVIGSFRNAGDTPAPGVARWDGKEWHALPGGMIDEPAAMIIHDGNLVVSGSAVLPDGTATPNLSIWGPTHARGDFDGDRFVDLTDLSHVPECMTGPSNLNLRLATSDCLCVFNSEGDSDIDLMDVGALQNKFTRK